MQNFDRICAMLRRVPLTISCRRFPSLLVALSTIALAVQQSVVAEKLQYNRDIRPILSDRCFKCHGPDKGSRKAGLRLDIADEAYAERKKSGEHAIVPGKPEASLVCTKVFASDPDDLMPPPESNLALTQKEKETLRRWIAEGAKYEPHWSFIPLPATVAVPNPKSKKWARNEIDRFVLARLEKEGLKPSPEASRERWLRRVSYDLTGLPPSPEEIEAFVNDRASNPYERVVERLLASPRFGERMAVPWLDAARYADSYGYQSDQLCPTWPYRDWVVRAFNRNLPYNEFIRDQIAGDLIPSCSREQRLATAFNRLHRQTNEGGSIEEEWRNEYVSDRIQTLSLSVMGLTFECARCHDHKFDPITQRDYYSLAAFFNSIDEWGLYNDTAHVPTPSLLLPDAAQEKAVDATAAGVRQKRKALAQAVAQCDPSFQHWLAKTGGTNAPASRPETLPTSSIPGLVAHFSFDELNATNQFVSDGASAAHYSGGVSGNLVADAHGGKAAKLNGDDEIAFPSLTHGMQPWEQYSVVFWLRIPAGLTNAVVFHNCQGTDTGFHGTELDLQERHLFFVIKRFWPGNAMAIRSVEAMPANDWVQIAVTSDGSGDADGLHLFANGKRLQTETVRNHLYKSPEAAGSGMHFGALMRSTGLKDALLDELRVFDRPLAEVEVAQLFDGHSLNDALKEKKESKLREMFLVAMSPDIARARAELSSAVQKYFKARNPLLETSVMEETKEARAAFVLTRGRYDAPKTDRTKVGRATPSFLTAFPAGAPKNRLGLAEWLTQPNHPLTARTAANRFWQMFFGRGIVETTENLGTQGAQPSHPELLDWLARDFVTSGWDVKALLKKIALSATYRQDSKLRPDLQTRDPENVLLARGPSHRLSAEMIRDTALAASGLMDERIGGPPVSPYSPGDLWRESNAMSPAYHQSVGGDLYRRSIYTVWKRTAPMADLSSFDAPSREVCIARRSVTSTPQQAFVLLNDTQFVEASRVLAEKSLAKQGGTDADAINEMFVSLGGRQPDLMESRLLNEAFNEQAAAFSKEPGRAKSLIQTGASKPRQDIDAVKLAAMTAVAQTIMNSDVTVWSR
jgi:hypothetical protein